MRVLLVIAALHGLVPGIGDAVESAVCCGNGSQLTHTDGNTDAGEHGPTHSCGVTLHSCGCCAGQPVLPELDIGTIEHSAPKLARCERAENTIVDRAPARPFRPPIA